MLVESVKLNAFNLYYQFEVVTLTMINMFSPYGLKHLKINI